MLHEQDGAVDLVYGEVQLVELGHQRGVLAAVALVVDQVLPVQ